jgi:hypothetical protein
VILVEEHSITSMAGMAVLNPAAVAGSPCDASGEVCVVPIGWKREYVQGRIVYISPSHSFLWSHSDVMSYLTTDGTCKCGLECPLFVDKIFNFDPACSFKREANLNDGDMNQNHNLCNQHRKLQALAHYRSILKDNPDYGHHQPQSPIHSYNRNHNNHHYHPHQLQQQQQHEQVQLHHHLQQQPQHDQQQLIRHQSHNGYDRRPSIQQQHHHQQLHIDTRSPHAHSLIPNDHLPHNHIHDASQHIVVNPGEVTGRDFITGYVNGNDTQIQQQQHHMQHQVQNHHTSPPDSRQHLHDVTAVTASITELIPSVGQLVPQMPLQHHHPAHVQYSLILPQQTILTMPADHAQHMLLSPQIVSSFPNHTITSSPFHHQQQQQHHFNPQQLVFDAQSNTSDLMKHRRKSRSSKKVRTVAAILNLTT